MIYTKCASYFRFERADSFIQVRALHPRQERRLISRRNEWKALGPGVPSGSERLRFEEAWSKKVTVSKPSELTRHTESDRPLQGSFPFTYPIGAIEGYVSILWQRLMTTSTSSSGSRQVESSHRKT